MNAKIKVVAPIVNKMLDEFGEICYGRKSITEKGVLIRNMRGVKNYQVVPFTIDSANDYAVATVKVNSKAGYFIRISIDDKFEVGRVEERESSNDCKRMEKADKRMKAR